MAQSRPERVDSVECRNKVKKPWVFVRVLNMNMNLKEC